MSYSITMTEFASRTIITLDAVMILLNTPVKHNCICQSGTCWKTYSWPERGGKEEEENKNHLFYSYTTEENYREWETSRPERFSSAFTMRCIKAWGWWLARKPRTLLCPDSHSATCKHICRTTHTIHSVEVFLFPQRCSICNQFRLTVDDSFNLTIRFSQESEAGRYNGIC